MHAVIELDEFRKAVKNLGLTEDEYDFIIETVALNPMIGDEIQGTGGMRKVRFAGKGKGKSGGYRTITFFSGENIPVFIITMYAKNKMDNFSASTRNSFKVLAKELVKNYKGDKYGNKPND